MRRGSAEREILQQHQRQPQREQRAHDDHAHEAHRAEGLTPSVHDRLSVQPPIDAGGGQPLPSKVEVPGLCSNLVANAMPLVCAYVSVLALCACDPVLRPDLDGRYNLVDEPGLGRCLHRKLTHYTFSGHAPTAVTGTADADTEGTLPSGHSRGVGDTR